MSRQRPNAAPERALLAVADLLLVAGVATVVAVLLVTDAVGGWVRVLLAGALLGLCPGYAVVSALYPVRSTRRLGGQPYTGWLQRVGLAVGASLFVLVLAVLPLSVLGFETAVVVGVVLATTLVGTGAAAVRRLRVPADVRIELPTAALSRDARAATVDAPPLDAALNVALAVAVVVGLATLAVGLAAPDRATSGTEVALAGDGAAGAETYTQGAAASLPLSVQNRAPEERSHTAIVALERVGDAGGEAAVLERAVLSRATVTVPAGETTTERIEFTPSLLGPELRLSVYVYVGTAPERPTPVSADYHLYRWVEVTSGSASQSAPGTAAVEG